MRVFLLLASTMAQDGYWESLRNQSPFEVLNRETDVVLKHYNSSQTGHYGDPLSTECKPDEAHVTIEGVSGAVCAPGCNLNTCPIDMPKGVSATPLCNIINWKNGAMFCSLGCVENINCGHSATCKTVGGVSFCFYD